MQQNFNISSSYAVGERKGSRSRSRDKQKKGRGRPSKKHLQSQSDYKEQNDEQFLDFDLQSLRSYESSLAGDKNRTAFQIMDKILVFFYAIGQERGMVFDQTQRKQFKSKATKDKNNRIKWTDRHQWHPDKQLTKLTQAAKLCGVDLERPQMKHFSDTLLEVSSLFAQQFTSQLYKLLLHIWLISRQKESMKENKMKSENIGSEENQSREEGIKQRLEQLAYRVCNSKDQYYCLSFAFKSTKDNKRKGEKEIKKQDRLKAYKQLVTSIHKSFQNM